MISRTTRLAELVVCKTKFGSDGKPFKDGDYFGDLSLGGGGVKLLWIVNKKKIHVC
jgi:hypothetical protein